MKRIVALILVMMLVMSGIACAMEVTSTAVKSGLLRFKDNKKYGYMDINGNVVISAQYIGGEEFNQGLAPVQYSSGGFARWKYIDVSGNTVIGNIDTSSRYYDFGTWQGDYGMVTIWKVKNGAIDPIGYNYITKSGRLITSDEFMYIGKFSEGYALVGAGSAYGKLSRSSDSSAMFMGSWSGNDFRCAASDYYYIDMEGNRLGSNTWSAGQAFSEGLAAVAIQGADGSNVWGYIDTTGNIAIGPQFSSAGAFKNGYATVIMGGKCGVIDTAGNLVVPCEYDSAGNFADNGLAAVKQGDVWGFVDVSGSMVIEPAYAYASTFMNGNSIVYDGFAYGIIDETGAYVVHPGYRYITRLGDLLVAQEFPTPVIVNENGEVVTVALVNGALPSDENPAPFADGDVCKLVSLGTASNGLEMFQLTLDDGTVVSMNMVSVPGTEFRIAEGTGKYMILDAHGDMLVNEKFESVNTAASTENCICVVKNNLYGYIAPTGEYLLVPQFSSVGSFSEGVAIAFMGTNMTVIDEYGQSVKPTIHKGSPKEDIRAMQQALIDQGFLDDVADGIYGGKTDAAIRAAQEAFGMEPTGVADSAFQKKLFGE